MNVQKCSKSGRSPTGESLENQNTKNATGQHMAKLQKELARLEIFEHDIKHRMQDRMKFMSSKNALRLEAELMKIDQQKSAVGLLISSFQQK
jgi:hypothetical protein